MKLFHSASILHIQHIHHTLTNLQSLQFVIWSFRASASLFRFWPNNFNPISTETNIKRPAFYMKMHFFRVTESFPESVAILMKNHKIPLDTLQGVWAERKLFKNVLKFVSSPRVFSSCSFVLYHCIWFSFSSLGLCSVFVCMCVCPFRNSYFYLLWTICSLCNEFGMQIFFLLHHHRCHFLHAIADREYERMGCNVYLVYM